MAVSEQQGHGHTSTLQKFKNLFNSNADTPAAADDDNERTIEHLHHERSQHELREQQADELIAQREAQEHAASGQPPVPLWEQRDPTGDDDDVPLARKASVSRKDSALSSFGPRSSLKRAARHDGANKAADMMPDTDGYEHIPESKLHHRSHEMQHTALRPSNPEDPTAMDGKPYGDALRSAGEDLSL